MYGDELVQPPVHQDMRLSTKRCRICQIVQSFAEKKSKVGRRAVNTKRRGWTQFGYG